MVTEAHHSEVMNVENHRFIHIHTNGDIKFDGPIDKGFERRIYVNKLTERFIS